MTVPQCIAVAIRVRAVMLTAVPETGGTPKPAGSLSADGVTVSATGQHVLLTLQATPANNGPWIYMGTSTPMQRAPEWDGVANIPTATIMIQVSEGTIHANSTWRLTTLTDPYVVGTTVPTLARVETDLNVKHFGVTGDGSADDSTSMTTAATAATQLGGVLSFPPGAYKTNSNITFASNVALQFAEGATLAPSGSTITINGRIHAHPTQRIFGSTFHNTSVAQVGSGPTVTVSATPVNAWAFKIQIVLAGLRGTAKFQYSLDNGTSWSVISYVTAATFLIPLTGVTVNFGNGATSYALNTTYSWTSSASIAMAVGVAERVSAKWWAMADVKFISNVQLTMNSTALHCASAAFTSADTGKLLCLNGTSVNPLMTTIASVSPPNDLTMADQWTQASASTYNAQYATDDTGAVQAALNAATQAANTTVVVPHGEYWARGPLTPMRQ